ncbi:MAG: glycosyltransferase family 2 protein [Ignavibacteriae bacterium]|nr:MAG: glycosyltransferase family 2 protein [Ignavibacteriota bacterium]
MAELSIIIITWNNENEIVSCVESIKKSLAGKENIDAELIIIDNNSSDNTFKVLENIDFPKLQVYKNEINTGFTKAVNQGIKYSSGKVIFLLNPDTQLMENSISEMYCFLTKNQDYGACAPRLLNEDGKTQYSIRNFPDYLSMYFEFTQLSCLFSKSYFFGKWKMEYFDYEQDADVPQPMAAALMIKRGVFEKVNFMDDRFIMFFNDVDLCKNIIENGYKIRYIKDTKIIHKKGVSIFKDRVRMIKTWNHDCIEYFKKHKNNFLLLTWLRVSLKITEIIRIIYYKLFYEK